jgi:hypothetical protein
VIPGLFDAAWTPPSRGPDHRFVVRGSTTARGGVLTHATSDWEVPGTDRKADDERLLSLGNSSDARSAASNRSLPKLRKEDLSTSSRNQIPKLVWKA